MRDLGEWTRYLEEQEQALHGAPASPETEVEQDQSTDSVTARADGKPSRPQTEQSAPDRTSDTAARSEARVDAPERKATQGSAGRAAAKPLVDKAALRKAARLRNRLPAHLEAGSIVQREVAEASYEAFKETREELIRRLLDPELSLEEVSRILNVCPTTVRRYTNRGLLGHHRTGGNQRRFRLSDVLAFLESQSGVPDGRRDADSE